MNQSALSQSIVDRVIGILTLKYAIYEEIEHDPSATVQAAIIVLIGGLATGIGNIGSDWSAIIGAPIGALIGWAITSSFIYITGAKLMPSESTEATPGQVLRLVGFAQVSNVVNILGFVPGVGTVLGVVGGILGVMYTVRAIMFALEMSVNRAISTAITASFVQALTIVGAAVCIQLWFQ